MESIRKCTNCKKNKQLEQYTKGNKILNQCLDCRNIKKKSFNKTKCIHGRRRDKCKECGGSYICLHGRQKNYCKECGGISICIHNKQKTQCKLCNDPIDITIKSMIHHSKEKDIKYNRYDELNFVNYNYLKNLILESNDRCCYCSCELQYIHYNHSLGTIERLNNNIGHNIGNCKIACHRCNLSKVGSTINPQL